MEEIVFKSDDLTIMSLINYFITEKHYNPMIIHGINDEIYLASNKFNMEDFIDYLNRLIELNDPTVVIL